MPEGGKNTEKRKQGLLFRSVSPVSQENLESGSPLCSYWPQCQNQNPNYPLLGKIPDFAKPRPKPARAGTIKEGSIFTNLLLLF